MIATLRRAWPVLLSYALFSIWGLGCFVTSIFLTSRGFGFAPESILALGGVFVAAGIGHVLGNVLGLAGFRLGPIVVLFTGLFIAAVSTGAFAGPLAVYPTIAVFAALGGYLGIGSRLDVVASWYPLTMSSIAAILWMNHHGAITVFRGGAKRQLWDTFTIVCLGGTAFFMLLFLATRNALGLTVWQEIGRPRGSSEGVTNARPGRGSIVVLLLATLAVLGTTAAISPYLFRTARSEDGQGQQEKEQRRRGQGGYGDDQEQQKAPQEAEPPPPKFDWEEIAELLRLALKVFLGILILAVLVMIFVYGVLPPIRRRYFLRHLVTPLWPVAPTARVMNLWRRALAALAMVDVEPQPGEPPIAFARRAEGELVALGPLPGLVPAAGIVERVHYAGRGLGPGDEDAMRTELRSFLEAVEPRIGLRKKLSAAFRQTPEVES